VASSKRFVDCLGTSSLFALSVGGKMLSIWWYFAMYLPCTCHVKKPRSVRGFWLFVLEYSRYDNDGDNDNDGDRMIAVI